MNYIMTVQWDSGIIIMKESSKNLTKLLLETNTVQKKSN